MRKDVIKDFKDLKLNKNYSVEQQEYQQEWSKNKFQHRKMIAKKNRKWLLENSESELKEYKEFPDVYSIIENTFNDESKRNWIIHIITNFLPLNKSKQVPKLPKSNSVCPFTGYLLTDIKNIAVGDRDKHIAFTGEQTNVVLSGIALQELNRLVINYTYNFDTPNGHIINYAIDKLRFTAKNN